LISRNSPTPLSFWAETQRQRKFFFCCVRYQVNCSFSRNEKPEAPIQGMYNFQIMRLNSFVCTTGQCNFAAIPPTKNSNVFVTNIFTSRMSLISCNASILIRLNQTGSGVNRRVQSVQSHGPPSPGGPQKEQPNRLACCCLSKIAKFLIRWFLRHSVAIMLRRLRKTKVMFCTSLSWLANCQQEPKIKVRLSKIPVNNYIIYTFETLAEFSPRQREE
jgi:hypothetical protein